MKLSKDEIIKAIYAFFCDCCNPFPCDFYIGITDNIENRLFVEHNVDREKDAWVYYEAMNKDEALDVEMFFQSEQIGMQGHAGGGNDRSVFVYCYETTPLTRQ